MIYYKVVRFENYKRKSAFIMDKHAIEYPVNTRVKADPMSAGIFVFKKEAQAEDFLKVAVKHYGFCGAVIKVKGHGPARHFKRIINPIRCHGISRFLNDFFYTKSWKNADYKVPEGTVAFNEITTLE